MKIKLSWLFFSFFWRGMRCVCICLILEKCFCSLFGGIWIRKPSWISCFIVFMTGHIVNSSKCYFASNLTLLKDCVQCKAYFQFRLTNWVFKVKNCLTCLTIWLIFFFSVYSVSLQSPLLVNRLKKGDNARLPLIKLCTRYWCVV